MSLAFQIVRHLRLGPLVHLNQLLVLSTKATYSLKSTGGAAAHCSVGVCMAGETTAQTHKQQREG